MADQKYQDLKDFLSSFLPELNTLTGFMFYSFICYTFVLFCGWLMNPAVDATLEADAKQRKLRKKRDAAFAERTEYVED